MYTLSNHNQNVMQGLWKDLPYKITKKVKENWLDNLFFLVPTIGIYQCAPGALAAARAALAARLGAKRSAQMRNWGVRRAGWGRGGLAGAHGRPRAPRVACGCPRRRIAARAALRARRAGAICAQP